ncbi:helicase, putative [Eimeria acervulina]|uniref:ATP-dependent RNA helicase n=1 Tax=Eimeria acervulina TaxID=5801 RepID=U6GD61_EIMAC|nr:helicase, putative [Eimeria acervulina]CDI78206.1 helicase, putative [Eimeria acervulina]
MGPRGEFGYRGPPRAKSKKDRVLAAAAAAAAATTAAAAAADSADAAAKKKASRANGVESSSTTGGLPQKKRKVQQQQQQQEEEEEEEQQQQEQQEQQREQQQPQAADEEQSEAGSIEPNSSAQQQQQQRQKQQQQQQQLRLPDWTDRYILVPDASDSNPEASAALLQQLHPAAAAAFRRLIGNTFFPIQLAVIPHLLRLLELPFGSPQASDVCVHAATGEGKTLCYALPLISHLFNSVVPRLRCVVLTPTRELALQVASVFNCLAGDRDRDRDRVGNRVGCRDGDRDRGADDPRALRVVCLAGETASAKRLKPAAAPAAAAAATAATAAAAEAAADVIVCTPGRFVDAAQVYIHHRKRGIKGRGPSFEALQWLVLDEADRLLRQSYHGWLDVSRLLAALRESPQRGGPQGGPQFELNCLLQLPPVRKILVSATMTRNPKALHDLQLYKPLFFFSSPTGSAITPSRLQQKYVLCRAERKPLVLIALLYQLANAAAAAAAATAAAGAAEGVSTKCGALRVAVFCGSRGAAHRLSRLLQLHFLSSERLALKP